jgi:cytidylate kinase
VRKALVRKQRELLANGDWVAEGRDIGTVVAPEAELKIFLSASPDERARRRAAEAPGTGDVRAVARELAERDARDRRREHSPLRPAADAVELDTTARTLEQVIAQVAELARERGARPGAAAGAKP